MNLPGRNASGPQVRLQPGIDLALRIGHMPDSSMVAVPVGHMRRVVCACPQLLREYGTPQHPEDLSARPCVQFQGTAAGGRWRFREDGRELGVKVSGRFSCSQALAAAHACADGLGFGMLLHYQVAPLVREGHLAIVLEAFEPEPFPVSLVYPEARLLSTRMKSLVAWLRDALRARLAEQEDEAPQ